MSRALHNLPRNNSKGSAGCGAVILFSFVESGGSDGT